MGAPTAQAAAQSYVEICQELCCQPSRQFLASLQMGSTVCKLSSFVQQEQLYAAASLLPYAGFRELDLSGLKLSVDAWCALLEACSKCQDLQVLSLKGCSIGALDEGFQDKAAAAVGACIVPVLDLSQNELGDSFVLSLAQSSLLCNGGQLTVLDLSENAIGDDGITVLAGLLEVEGANCQLRQLDLSFNQIGDQGACAVASMMLSVALLAMELEGNQVGDIGGLALAAALNSASQLKRLNLNHNKLSSQALSAIADALTSNPGVLQELAVSGAHGSEAGAAALLLAAASSSHLKLLDIRGLAIKAEAVDAVCQLLASKAAITTLRLDVATKDAAEGIAQALPSNNSLLELMLGGPVPEHVLSFVAARLHANTISKQQHGSPPALAANSWQGSNPAAAQSAGRVQQEDRQQHQQANVWSPNRPASCGPLRSKGSPGSLRFIARSPASAGKVIHKGSSPMPGRPASANGFGSVSAGNNADGRRSLVRTTTQQARQLSTLDMSGLAGLAGGGAASKAAEVFRRHDNDASGYLDAEEMMAALQELGMLEGMKAKHLGKFLSNTIKEINVDQDGRVSMEEFIKYYERLARYYAEAARQGRIVQRSKPPMVPLEAASDEQLRKVFKAYCRLCIGQGRQVGGSVQHINAAQFHQMCKDAGVLEPQGPLSQCAVDIVFTRCKPVGRRRLAFKEFLEAAAAVAEEAGCSFNAITEALLINNSPRPGSPISSPTSDGGFYAGNALLATAVARGRTPNLHLCISDLTDTKVGPMLPNRPKVVRSLMYSSSQDTGLLSDHEVDAAAAGKMRASAAAVLWGGDAADCGTPASVSASAHKPALHSSSPMQPTAAGARAPIVATAGQRQQEQQENAQALQLAQLLEARLAALEEKMGVAGHTAAAAAYATAPAAAAARSDLCTRLMLLEAAAADHQQQLSAVAGQQEALKEVVTRLVESLEAANLGHNSHASSSDLHELSNGVKSLSSEVASLKAVQSNLEGIPQQLEEKMLELLAKSDDRQAEAETAIRQVACLVDVLDSRLRDEQESSLKALEALLASTSLAEQ